MAQITMLVGPPGSGKSTIAHDLINNDGDHGAATVRISQDDQGRQGHMELFERAIQERQNIIVDRMNFNKAQRDKYLEPARKAGYDTVIIVVHVPKQVCLDRCNARVGHPTIQDPQSASKAVNFFFSNYERVVDSEANLVKRRGWIANGPEAIICDLDGTLCNIEHRRHHVRPAEGVKKNWPAFFAGIPNDTIHSWCAMLLQAMAGMGVNIVYCSGRGDNEREATVAWLKKNKVAAFDDGSQQWAPLYMRNRQDSRKDSIVKEIILDFEILTRYTPIFMIDDRQQVVDMWRKRGFTCLQCDVGDF